MTRIANTAILHHHNTATQFLQKVHLLFGLIVRHDDNDGMTSRAGEGGEGYACGAGCALDEYAVGFCVVEGCEDDFVDVGWNVGKG